MGLGCSLVYCPTLSTITHGHALHSLSAPSPIATRQHVVSSCSWRSCCCGRCWSLDCSSHDATCTASRIARSGIVCHQQTHSCAGQRPLPSWSAGQAHSSSVHSTGSRSNGRVCAHSVCVLECRCAQGSARTGGSVARLWRLVDREGAATDSQACAVHLGSIRSNERCRNPDRAWRGRVLLRHEWQEVHRLQLASNVLALWPLDASIGDRCRGGSDE
jgi:hypothetical protein